MENSVIAVIGVSADPAKFGFKIFKSLLIAGYKVYGVNPKGGEVAGQRVYAAVGALPQKPEIALLVVPPASALASVKPCAEAGVKIFWMQPGSDSDEVERAAETAGMHVVRGACFMAKEGVW